MIERKDKFYREFLENTLFNSCIVIGIDGCSIAYNKCTLLGENDAIIKGFRNIKKWNNIKLIGEEYQIYNRTDNKIFAQNDKHTCIIVKINKAYIVGIFPKKQEITPRLLFIDKFSKEYDSSDIIKIDEKEKFVF